MFYSQFILAKKGPLGTIWIAAHLERKLRKNQVADTDIGVSVDSILSPDVPIALRLSSHLLVGVVRIYSRKVNYLFDDCSEALLKVKQAFRSAAVDLPPEESKAPYHSITLPETFELDDFELPDNDIFHGNFVDHHISSRDQITLQDTLDGVTYSTSKFGLDERFGDGDASGLDLDEELLMEKVDAAGFVNERSDPQSSVGPMTPLKQDEHPEIRNVASGNRGDDVDDYADLMEYAQAPCTPGLVEEPNLPNVQEVSACDEHMESEYHLGESTMMENEKNNTYEDKQEVNWSSHDNKDSDGAPMVLPEKYEHHSDGLNINSPKPQEESPVGKADVEHVPDSIGLGKSVDTSLEMADKIVGTSHVSGTEDLQNGVLPVDEPDLHQGPYETGFVKSSSEISGLASTCHQDEPQSHESQVSNEPGDPSSLNLDVHEKVASSGTPFIRPCNSNMDQPDLISGHAMSADAAVQSYGIGLEASGREDTVITDKACSRADNLEEISKENHMQGDALQASIDAASKKPDSEVMNASTHDVMVDNLNNSAEANLPVPGKLLSVPEDIVDQHNNMLAELSPGEFVGLDASDAGSKVVSGKKRGFTESTLTEQSLNSVESSRMIRFKGTIESVPNDDDLLSSILVGRSSVLKVKSTPRPSEVASTKRARSAPRTGAPKRKVLMDDTMVLHGDMIRQQLTNSEDIRRVRKKAPCTRSEISLIQKKNLEDENFLEPLFTGIATELVPLHSQMWDLRGIQICNNDLNDSLQNIADLKLPSENDKDAPPETTTAPISRPDGAKNEDCPTTAAEPQFTSHAENCESLDIGIDEASGRHNVAEQSAVNITNELLSDRDSEMAKPSESQPDDDVGADVSREEPLLDVSGVEASDKNDFLSCPSADVVQMNAVTETFETPSLGNADTLAGLSEQEKDAPSAGMDADDGQASGGDVLVARDGDGDFNDVFGTEPLVKDDIFEEVARESATVELLSDSKEGHLEFNGHNEMHSAILAENIEYPSYAAQQEDFMENGRSPERPEAHHDYMMGAESSGFNLHDQEGWMFSAAGNDNNTDFLNVDDDELNEMDDDHIPDDEETKFIENTGWSSRTRAVTKYLQMLFVKEAEQGRRSLSLDNLLVGKSRKEASRMFFETLVLKTRDYIHVEQQIPFDGIAIKPRSALMKSGF